MLNSDFQHIYTFVEILVWTSYCVWRESEDRLEHQTLRKTRYHMISTARAQNTKTGTQNKDGHPFRAWLNDQKHVKLEKQNPVSLYLYLLSSFKVERITLYISVWQYHIFILYQLVPALHGRYMMLTLSEIFIPKTPNEIFKVSWHHFIHIFQMFNVTYLVCWKF